MAIFKSSCTSCWSWPSGKSETRWPLAEAKVAHALQGAAAKKNAEIQALQAKLEAGESGGVSTSFDLDAFLKTKRQKLAGSVGKDAATQ